jgi:hypothetical protein
MLCMCFVNLVIVFAVEVMQTREGINILLSTYLIPLRCIRQCVKRWIGIGRSKKELSGRNGV